MGGFSDKLGTAVVEIRATFSRLKSDLNRATGLVRRASLKMSTALKTAGASMSKALTLPLALFGAAILKAGGDFESAMNRVRVLTNATGSSFDALSMKAQELGRTTAFSATEAAEGMAFLAQAGFDTKEILSSIGPALSLAAAGAQDLATTADQLSNIMQGFRLGAGQAGQAADVLAKGASSSNTNISQLAEGMKFVAPIAASLGQSLEDVTAVMGFMGNSAIQGTMAGTSLRMGMLRLIDPTKGATEVLNKYGIQINDSRGKMRRFIDILDDLGKANLSAAEMTEIFGVRSVSAMLAVIDQGVPKLREFSEVLSNSVGEAARQAEGRLQGFNGQITRLKSALEGLAIALAQSGMLRFFTEIATTLTTFVSKLAEASPATLRFTTITLGLIAVLGPLAFVIGTLISPLGLVITALSLISAALVVFRNQIWNTFVTVAQTAIQTFTNSLIAVADALSYIDPTGHMARMSANLKASTSSMISNWEKLKGAAGDVGAEYDAIKESYEKLKIELLKPVDIDPSFHDELDTLDTKADKLGTTYKKSMDKVATSSVSAANTMQQAFQSAFQSLASSIGGPAGAFLGPILGAIGGQIGSSFNSGGGVGSIFDGISSSIGNLFGGFFADGGRPSMGKVSVVGERGPELFVPDSSGTIIPNGAGGGGGVNVSLQPIFVGVDAQIQQKINQATPQIVAQAKTAVSDAINRGDKRFNGRR